jgi:Tfp pilus assembly protein PilO
MGDLEQTRKRFVTVAVSLGVINLALLVYLLWPGTSHAAQQADEAALQQKYATLKLEVERWQASNPENTREDLKRLYAEDVPARWSQISQQIEKLLKENGVSAQSIHYVPDNDEKSALPNVQRIKIDTSVTGDYTKVAKFINAMEQNKLLFIIDKISLSGQAEGGTVTLQITFNTFLKETA